MEFFYKKFPKRYFNLYPFGDIHYGSPQCNVPFVRQTIDTIAEDPDGYWVGMGDLMENAIVGSLSDVYTQTASPEEQAKQIAEWLEPIKHKGLWMIGGNHEQRSHRATGMTPEEYISAELGRDDKGKRWVPFLGFSVYAIFQMNDCHTPDSFRCYFHHNRGGGRTKGGKVNAAEKLRLIVPTADAIFSAHTHTTSRMTCTWYDVGRKNIIKKEGYNYIIGSALEYPDSYADEKGMPPATVEFIKVHFQAGLSGRGDHRKQTYSIITPDRSQCDESLL